MTAPALRPCPFCGGKPQLVRAAFSAQWLVRCPTCNADRYARDAEHSAAAAIAAWNRRPEPRAEGVK